MKFKNLALTEDLLFGENEVVDLSIIDFHEDAKTGSEYVKCKILSGNHSGKEYVITLQESQPFLAKRKLNFYKAFWTVDQIKNGEPNEQHIIGRNVAAKAGKVNVGKDGRKFQAFEMFKDKGLPTPSNIEDQSF